MSNTTGSGGLVPKPVSESSNIQPVVSLDDKDTFEPGLTPQEWEFLEKLMEGWSEYS